MSPVIVKTLRVSGENAQDTLHMDSAFPEPRQGVDRHPGRVDDFEVEVRAGGEPSGSHARDDVSCVDSLTRHHVERLHVTVGGRVTVVVEDADESSVTPCGTGFEDDSGLGGSDGGVGGVGDVDSCVEGSPARTETGGENTLSGEERHLGSVLGHSLLEFLHGDLQGRMERVSVVDRARGVENEGAGVCHASTQTKRNRRQCGDGSGTKLLQLILLSGDLQYT